MAEFTASTLFWVIVSVIVLIVLILIIRQILPGLQVPLI